MPKNNTIIIAVGLVLIVLQGGFFALRILQEQTRKPPVSLEQLNDASSLLENLDAEKEKSTTIFTDEMLSDETLRLK